MPHRSTTARSADQPFSGQHRVTCNEGCEIVSFDGYRKQGRIWNVSVGGTYAVLPPTSFPPLGRKVLLTFTLPGDALPITCEARVQWHNEHSVSRERGSTKPALPPGLGLAFVVLEGQDAGRIATCVAAFRSAPLRLDG